VSRKKLELKMLTEEVLSKLNTRRLLRHYREEFKKLSAMCERERRHSSSYDFRFSDETLAQEAYTEKLKRLLDGREHIE